MGIETITTSAEALAYINSHLNITTAELQQLASQMRADVPNAQSVLLYSGNLQTIPGADALPSFEIAEFIGSSSPANAKVATIGQTEAGKCCI